MHPKDVRDGGPAPLEVLGHQGVDFKPFLDVAAPLRHGLDGILRVTRHGPQTVDVQDQEVQVVAAELERVGSLLRDYQRRGTDRPPSTDENGEPTDDASLGSEEESAADEPPSGDRTGQSRLD